MRTQLFHSLKGFSFSVAVLLLAACQTTLSTVHVDQNTVDASLPSVLTLQATAPGQSTQIVMRRNQTPGFPDVSIEVNATDKVRLVLVAKDPESGIQRLELAGLMSAYRGGSGGWTTVRRDVHDNFGFARDNPGGLPQDYPISMTIDGELDVAQLLQQFDGFVIHLAAVAKSGSPQLLNDEASTNAITLIFKPAGTPPFPSH